jgi:hypothetical protein
MIQKRWFHATTKENWEKIKKEGLQSGTFLARNLEELIRMIYLPLIGDLRKCELILSVRYTPNDDDKFDPKSWEMIAMRRIDKDNLKLLKYL